MTTYVIGDIHGCFSALTCLFNKLTWTPQDTFVFLGDMIDRGENSKEVIDFILCLKKQVKVICLKGNHEVMLLKAAEGHQGVLSAWLTYGGVETLDSYQTNEDEEDWTMAIPQAHWIFFENLLPYYETVDYIFVHAGLDPFLPLKLQSENDLFWEHLHNGNIKAHQSGKTIIVGHTILKEGYVYDYGHTIMTDTAAYAGGWLSCYDLEQKVVHQANIQSQYRQTNPIKQST